MQSDIFCVNGMLKRHGVKKIELAGTKEIQDEIYQVLETLIDERDKEKFKQLLS